MKYLSTRYINIILVALFIVMVLVYENFNKSLQKINVIIFDSHVQIPTKYILSRLGTDLVFRNKDARIVIGTVSKIKDGYWKWMKEREVDRKKKYGVSVVHSKIEPVNNNDKEEYITNIFNKKEIMTLVGHGEKLEMEILASICEKHELKKL